MVRIGIDFGGTNIAAGLVRDGHIVDRESVPTAVPRPLESMVDDMAALTERLLARNGLTARDLASVGVGVPCTANEDNGHMEDADWLTVRDAAFLPLLAAKLDAPVRFSNDANCAAWGEFVAGGWDVKSLILVTLGTGIGGGVILDGKLWTGVNFAAGEFGHMVLRAGGEPCCCGRRGCFEAYASATALVRAARRRGLAVTEARQVFAAASAGDGAAAELLEEYTTDLAEGLANIINIFQPEVLCLGGGVSHAGAALLDPVRAKTAARVYSKAAARNTRLELARLGNDAGILGAALL